MPSKPLPVLVFCLTLCLLANSGCEDPDPEQTQSLSNSLTTLNEAGTIAAANTVAVNGPGWRSHRITWLIPEGTQVAPGDTIIRFDTSDFDEYIKQNSDELDAMRLAVTSARAQGRANRIRSGNSIDKSRLAHEKALLELENQQYESQSMRDRSVLDSKQAEIDLEQAERGLIAQATLDSLEIAQAVLKETKQEARVRRYQSYRDQLISTAPATGMVVYHREYTEEGIKSYRAGDEVQRQAPVLDITDTSLMKVAFTVHEKDRWRLKSGQKVRVILDAYTDTVFTGQVENVGRLPRAAVDGNVARRFEATATIDIADARLKPGMSARVIIELGGSM
jgi:multidrug efflux pump subunit AcrA (membrane-fusion protein)